MSDLPEFETIRIFNAPRALVWKAWTDPVLLARWYGPGVETIIHEYDLRPGGVWLNEMKWGDKSDRSRMDFQSVDPESHIVWHHSSTNMEWEVAPSQMMPDWPRTLLTTLTFEQAGTDTKVTLHQVPLEATAAEIACFAAMKDGMSGGWGKGFAMIDEILTELS